MALLEEELKLLLFNRSGRTLRVTEKGAAFYVATRHILAGLGEIPRIAKDIQASEKQFKLVTTPRIAQGLISPAIQRMRGQPEASLHHRCAVALRPGQPRGAAPLRSCDRLAPVTHALVELENHPLFRVRLEAVMRKDHPLASRKRVTAADLAARTWSVFGKISCGVSR